MPRSTWGTSRVLGDFEYGTFTLCGVIFHPLLLSPPNPTLRPRNPFDTSAKGLASSLFARRYWGNPLRFLFLEVLRCFNSLRIAPYPYVFKARYPDINLDGLPHSGILGSKPAYGYPGLFAVRHALHRLSVPRHPPYTLNTLTNKFIKPYWSQQT